MHVEGAGAAWVAAEDGMSVVVVVSTGAAAEESNREREVEVEVVAMREEEQQPGLVDSRNSRVRCCSEVVGRRREDLEEGQSLDLGYKLDDETVGDANFGSSVESKQK